MQFRILHYETLQSTNDFAKELLKQGASEGLVVFADYQTDGRGRFERRWQSPKGKDLLFSLVVKPRLLKANQVPLMTQVAAASIRDTIQKQFGIKSNIKKPNDVLIDGKKVCGILIEASTTSPKKTIDGLVIGIGINVNSRKKELLKTATSLYEATGVRHDRIQVLNCFLNDLRDSYQQLLTKGM